VLDAALMRIISTAAAPRPVAAYSQAVEAKGFVFTAGQLGTNPATGKLEDTVEAQAEQAFANIGAILNAAGSSVERIVKVNLYLADMTQFAAVNVIYEKFIGLHRPARTTIEASALPAGAFVEVDVIATTRE
jgi:2-iminobutanoate/2-iminopropanoate deaminase